MTPLRYYFPHSIQHPGNAVAKLAGTDYSGRRMAFEPGGIWKRFSNSDLDVAGFRLTNSYPKHSWDSMDWRDMRFAHTNIAAKNWKALADFYIEVFQCRVKPPERKLSGLWLDRATGLPNVRLEGVHLILPGCGDDGPTLEIFSYKDMQTCEPCMPNRPGLTHIAFEVDDVDRTLQQALENGAQSMGRVSKMTVDGVCSLKFVYIRDPEGNIVEIQSCKRWKKQSSSWSSPAMGTCRSK